MKTIVFGDIHGCHEEWQDLLDKIGPSSDDKLISVGDLVFKGPSTRQTLDIAMRLQNFHSVMGNHDLLLLRLWEEEMLDRVDLEHQKQAIAELRPDMEKYMTFIAGFPYFLDLPECIVVHGGLKPGIPLEDQSLNDLVNLRTLEDDRPWYESYTGNKLVLYGHWALKGLNVRKNTIGLDSGCVYGKTLSAVILPERKIVSVPARKAHLPV